MARATGDVEVKIHYETEKAWFISTDGVKANAVWIPKFLNGEELLMDEGSKGYAILTAPEWFLAEKELV